jgi:hypothetical protein
MDSTCETPPVGLQDKDRGEFARFRAAAGPTGKKLPALDRLMTGTAVTIPAQHLAPRRAPLKSSLVSATSCPAPASSDGGPFQYLDGDDCGHPCFAHLENGDETRYI